MTFSMQFYDGLLLKEHILRTQESWSLERDCLERHFMKLLDIYDVYFLVNPLFTTECLLLVLLISQRIGTWER